MENYFKTKLQGIAQKIQASGNFFTAMRGVQPLISDLLGCERITLYQSSDNGRELRASFRTEDDDVDVRVPFSPSSISGYVAMSRQPVLIRNLEDAAELAQIHPDLRYDPSFARSAGLVDKTMVVVPILSDRVLLGVLQLINKQDGSTFTRLDLQATQLVAQVLAKFFAQELQSTQGPFDYLIQQGLISCEQMDQARQQAKEEDKKLDQVLVEMGLGEDDVGQSLAQYYRVPFMRFNPAIKLPGEVMKRLKRDYLRANLWAPVFAKDDEVVLLIDDPSDHTKLMHIEGIIGAKRYAFRVGLSQEILKFLEDQVQVDESSLKSQALKAAREVGERSHREEVRREDYDATDDSSGAVGELVNHLLMQAEQNNASDIHIEPGMPGGEGTVRIRVDGVCREILRYESSLNNQIVARIKVMSRLDIAEKRVPQDGKFKIRLPHRSLELRVATVPTVFGESLVMRLLAAGNALPLGALNLNAANRAQLERLIAKPHGLFLVVGPTGSGKTTTLHGVLGHINTPERKIWTAEDPVEITQPGLQQVQINRKAGLDFASALRSFLRADPDVILIGEMRDAETAGIGIEASLTGHLVLSTLHTNSAVETIIRLLDLGLDPINFSDALLGILAQRLVRTLCKTCKQAYRPSDKELDHLEGLYGAGLYKDLGLERKEASLCKAVGCADCGGTGYRGRTGIHELLVATPALKELTYRNAEMSQIKAQAINDGMRTLYRDGILKIFQGDTDYQQLLRVTSE
jgi:type II secretory ATPase GspE/PulE/Tfp pilus assembly ATPase PilB-like protein